MKAKNLIKKQIKRKTSKLLVETIIAAKKNENWSKIAGILSSPRKNKININLEKIDEETKEGESILIPGKVLSQGQINKKIKVVALNFSEKAKDKLLKSKCDVLSIIEEIKKNPEAKNIKILMDKQK